MTSSSGIFGAWWCTVTAGRFGGICWRQPGWSSFARIRPGARSGPFPGKTVMGVTIAVSVITAVVAAAGTYLGTYLNNISLARRQDQLARVNAQLKDLYGPLAALLL